MNRWIAVFFLLAVCCITINARSKQDVLTDKVTQLTQWAAKRSVIKLTSAKFMTYVKNKPRNYSMIVMFTALNPQRRCTVCHEANDEYTILANSYRFSSSFSNELFFGVLDYDDGQEAFHSLGLSSAPSFIHFPAKGKRKGVDTFDIQRQGFNSEQLAKWVQDRTGTPIRIFRPPNYTGTVIFILTLCMVGSFLYIRRNSLEFLQSKTVWSGICIFIILLMTSGQMWNHIRGPPLYHRNPHNGMIGYIHGHNQSQLVAETYIVFFIYSTIVIGFILLNDAFESKSADASKRRNLAISGLVLVIFFFSLLLSVFRRKYSGYPYTFLFR